MFTPMRKTLPSFEDPERALLGRNIRSLELCGVLFSKKKLFVALSIAQAVNLFIFTCTQWTEAYFIRNDLIELLDNVSRSCPTAFCGVKCITFIVWQKKWRDVIEYVTRTDQELRSSKDPSTVSVVQGYTNYSRVLTHIYWAVTVLTVVGAVATPVAIFIFTPDCSRKVAEGSMPFPHILSSWVPFEKNTFPNNVIVIVYQLNICVYGASVMASYDPTALLIMKFLEKRCQILVRQCEFIYKESEGTVADCVLRARIEDCHRAHTDLIKYSKLFNSLLSPIMFIYILTCSLYLCASAVQLTLDTSVTQKMFSIEYLLFGISQLFVFCLHGNNAIFKSAELSYGLYTCDWPALDAHNQGLVFTLAGQLRQTLVFMLQSAELSYGPYTCDWPALDAHNQGLVFTLAGQLRQTLVFMAGPFSYLNMATFIAILKGAYSYYTLLNS